MNDNIFETYLDNNFQTTEGYTGVRNFEKLAKILGYGSGYGGSEAIHDFLSDNPGAIQAILEFVQIWVDRNPEWREKLEEYVEFEQEETR